MNHKAVIRNLLVFLFLFLLAGELPAQDMLTVMPLGNSITRGTMCINGNVNGCVFNPDNQAIGYRRNLHDLLTGAGYNVDFVGARSDGYAIMTDPQHSGFSGMRNYQIAEIMETGYTDELGTITVGPYMNTYPAQLILLHTGSNDVFQTITSVSDVARILDEIKEFETAAGIPVLVFVAKIISQKNYPCGTGTYITTYNNNLTSLVQSRINNGDHLALVNMECGATINYYTEMADQLHPAQDGYDKMGDYWFEVIDNYNSAPAVSTIPDQVRDRGIAFSPLSLDAYVNDAEDSDAQLTWSWAPASPVHFTVSIDGSRNVTVSPKDPNWSGSEEITFTVTDRGRVLSQLKKSNNVAVTFTVNWVPEIIGQEEVTTPEDNSVALQVSDIVMVEPEKAPGGLQLLVSDGPHYSISGTTVIPEENYYGDLTVPVRLSGGGKVSDVYNLTVEVTPVNDIPVIQSQARPMETIQNSCLDVVYADLNVTDVDDTYPNGFTILIQPGEGYTYSGNRVCPDPPVTGMLDVELTVYDGSDQSEPFTVQVKVLSLVPEFILPETREVDQDQLYSQLVEINHYDPASFHYSLVDIPDWLDLNTETGLLDGTPANGDVGEHTLELKITNGTQMADTTFVITVHNVNDPPVFLTQALDKAKTNVMYEFQLDVEDVDPDDQLVFRAEEKPGWLEIDSTTGILSGIPSRGDVGTANVRLCACDGTVTTKKEYSLEVVFYNNEPEFVTVPDDTVEMETTYMYGVQADDADGDPISYFANEVPEWAQFFPESQVLIGTPGKSNGGTFLVILGAEDGMDTTYQVFTIEVVFPTSTPVTENRFEENISLYPNPAGERFFIKISDPSLLKDPLTFTLIDQSGRVVSEHKITGSLTEIESAGNIGHGTFIYLIQSDRNHHRMKKGKIILH